MPDITPTNNAANPTVAEFSLMSSGDSSGNETSTAIIAATAPAPKPANMFLVTAIADESIRNSEYDHQEIVKIQTARASAPVVMHDPG